MRTDGDHPGNERRGAEVVHLVPGGGLLAHEGVEGGHTLAKHVGKSLEFLCHRLATEPGITAASSFHSRQVAESAISSVLRSHDKEVRRWLAGPEDKLTVAGQTARPCGSVISRNRADPIESSAVRIALRRSPALGPGYRIHTAMVV